MPTSFLLKHTEVWRSTFVYLLLAAATAAYLHPFVRELAESPDSGTFLNGAAMVAQGAVPSRDFVEFSGPGTFLWLGLFFRLFGTTLMTARVVLSATGVGITALVFYLSRTTGAAGLFAALFAAVMSVSLLPQISPHYDSNLFALAAFAIFMMAWRRLAWNAEARVNVLLICCGVLTGFASWFVQQKGLFLAVALAMSLIILLGRRGLGAAGVLAGAFAAVMILELGLFAILHALPDLIYANYLLPMTSYGEVNAAPYGFPVWQDLWPAFLAASKTPSIAPLAWFEAFVLTVPFLLVMVLPIALPLLAFVAKVNPLHPKTLPLWLGAYALWFSELHRLDIGHLRNGCILMAVLFFAICETSAIGVLKIAGLTVTGCLVVGAMSHFVGTRTDQAIATRRGTAYMQVPQPVLPFLASHTKPGDNVFVYPYQPAYYFLADVRNPTRFSYFMYHYNSDAQFRKATQELEQLKVRYVLYDNELSGANLARLFPAYRHPAAADLIMEPYLEAHYREVETAGRFRILERRN